MFAYIVRRLVLMLVTLFGISVIIFVLLRVVPGNIVDILFDAAGFVDPADKANLERELGLDQSIVVQYLHWIGGLLSFDLGSSHAYGTSVAKLIGDRLAVTLPLGALALATLAPAVWVENLPCAALYFCADFGRNAALGAGVLYFLRSIKGQAAVLLAACFSRGWLSQCSTTRLARRSAVLPERSSNHDLHGARAATARRWS